MATKSVKKTVAKKQKDIQTLVIVESPSKAKTIEKYLGKGYTVKASMGHLIDLPKSRMAIDVEHNFEPEYITVRGRSTLLRELQGDAKRAEEVLLASDNDREGEAIAWHLGRAISEKTDVPIRRIVFNEITPNAIREAVKHPREIDEAKVNAQKARRVLDRLVGYNLSPLLWKKVKSGLSAGRVQSVALRLICEREAEVESFIPEEYWTLAADFKKGKTTFPAQLALYDGKKPSLKNEAEVNNIIEEIRDCAFTVSDVKESVRSIKPNPPFTTSTMQQAAANRLNFTSRKTMQIAQQLYEGVNIGSDRIGLITYMRTDSVRISPVALDEVRKYIGEKYPADLPPSPNFYATSKKAQDAHEGIRPTFVRYTPDFVQSYLNKDQLKLYTLIWERFVASQMKNAKTLTLTIDITSNAALFRAHSTKVVEKGFYNVMKLNAREESGKALPSLQRGDELEAAAFHPEQHFTQGPARYTDASIVKALEEKGIGRPSTYAPTISVLIDRYYVSRTNKQLVPTQLGRIINDILVQHFPDVIDVGFTATVENELDQVEENEIAWQDMIAEFFFPFKKQVDAVTEELGSMRGVLDEPTDYTCEVCGKPMVKKLGRFGFFLACSGYPECKNTRSIPLAKCPRPGCNGYIVARKRRGRGREFYGCTNYPECDFITYDKPLNAHCPKCGQFLVEKYDKKKGTFKACINPDCDYLHTQDDEVIAAEQKEK